ncbi:TPA: YheU family protein [Legionella pneumophila]|nr:YheU family protein [Legionella pneumophila]HAU1500470.1 YheU family protein [Legionella pneumophila]HAU1519464.1 YheU family protein [Legionella pneumophila]
MIEIDPSLLSRVALDNLISEVITRQGTDYGHNEIALELKTEQLRRKIEQGLAIIIYSAKEHFCDIVSVDKFQEMQKNEGIQECMTL